MIQSHAGIGHLPALGPERLGHGIAAGAIDGEQLGRPIGKLLEGGYRAGLEGQGLVEINHGLYLGQGLDQRRCPHGKGQPEAAQAPALGEGEKFNASLAPTLAAQQGGGLTLQG